MERPPRACSSASGPPSTSSSSSSSMRALPIRRPTLLSASSAHHQHRLPRAIEPSRRRAPALRAARVVSARATPGGAPSSGVAATAREVAIGDASAREMSAPAAATAGGKPEQAAAAPPPSRPPLPAAPAAAVALSRELPAAPNAASAVSALTRAVSAAEREFSAFRSGLVRLEVPLPPQQRSSPSSFSCALSWLAAQSDSDPRLLPRVFFSPRRDPPGQGTSPGAAAAAAAAAGAGGTAGVGSAWLWRGGGAPKRTPKDPSSPSSSLADALGDAGRFLSGAAASPRVRAFVAGRFDGGEDVEEVEGGGSSGTGMDQGWAPFGAFTVVIPRLEYVEASTCDFLCCTLAWRDGEEEGEGKEEGNSPSSLSLSEAAAAALASLRAASTPSASSQQQQPLPSPGARILSKKHLPDEERWAEALNPVVSEIEKGCCSRNKSGDDGESESGGEEGASSSSSSTFDTRLARDEFRANGVAGLESLLASLEPFGGGEEKKKEEEASSSSSLPPALSKVVLARRTDVDFGSSSSSPSSGGVDPTELVAALSNREPRAYQFLLDLGAPKEEGGDEISQSFLPAFVCSSPEQLYARSGRAVASEAVAGTRARGAPGNSAAEDAEASDFWLSLDLLSHPKDHAEFVIVRDWVAGALERVCGGEEQGGEEEEARGAGAGDEQSRSSSSSSPPSSSSSSVRIDRPKGILKQGGVQHLHARLSGTLRGNATDADVLAALHPTPAVCGRPRALAKKVLREREGFDRGLYAGPVGWVSGSGAEFAVAIRSARLDRDPGSIPEISPPQQQQQQQRHHPAARLSAFAGVGVVKGSRPRDEWAELELKAEQLLAPLARSADPRSEPNPAAAAAALVVEELCRLGCPAFCVAPGARSSPLALAVARHPVAAVRLHRGLDERSLAFFALGIGKATGKAACVITTSGTAVANLLPAAVEASMAGAPLLLLTADRPFALRGTGANQTIDQVGIFGGHVRRFSDVTPPCSESAAAGEGKGGGGVRILSEVGSAFDAACRGVAPSSLSSSSSVPPCVLPGPAHLNLQLSEPLGRSPGKFPESFWSGTESWLRGKARFREEVKEVEVGVATSSPTTTIPASLLELIASAKRPLLVLGEARTAEDAAAASRIAAALNGNGRGGGSWPVAADALSGVRVGRRGPLPPWLLSSPDAALASGDENDKEAWRALKPDLVLQVGGRLTSKRLAAFLGWAVSENPTTRDGAEETAEEEDSTTSWVLVDEACDWFDPAGPGTPPTARVQAPAAALAAALEEEEGAAAGGATASLPSSASAFASLWRLVDAAASSAAAAVLEADTAAAAAVSSLSSAAFAASTNGNGRSLGGGFGGGGGGGAATGLLSEPAAVALVVARGLPRGAALFVGNSMPIRDVEAYSSLPSSSSLLFSRPPPPSLGDSPTLPGAPSAPRIAASRGASGIDGVLSTAAGFAAGSGRPTTLVVGDLSFLHDTNGLALLRDGEGRPPLTVVVLNNDGGGIFHLVQDIAGGTRKSSISTSSPSSPLLSLGELDAVWATPQGADLGALCRAHGVPHQRVFSGSGSGSSSSSIPAAAGSAKEGNSNNAAVAALSSALAAAAALGSSSVVEVVCPRRERNAELHRALSRAAGQAGAAAARLWAAAGGEVAVVGASVRSLRIPLARPLTTSPSSSPLPYRQCFLLRLDCETGDGRRVSGEGEVSPLPGLSSESAAAAAAQAATLCSILNGGGDKKTPLPLDAPALAGGMTRWLSSVAGEGEGKGRSLAPSVRFGVEAAALGALSEAAGCSVPGLLAGLGSGGDFSSSPASPSSSVVPVAGLVSAGSPAEAAAAAAALVAAAGGRRLRAVKVKVARKGSTPSRDAEIVRAVAEAVSGGALGVKVRADANRGWTLEQASEFASALEKTPPPVLLDFLEEPLVDPGLDLESFSAAFPLLPLALDETVDEALAGGGRGSSGGGLSELLLSSCSSSSVVPAALVLKPTVVGGFDAVAAAARAASAASSGKSIIRCVVSSAFEGAAGLGAAAALALAVAPPRREGEKEEEGEEEEVHGLGTASWFSSGASVEDGSSVSAERAGKIAEGAAIAAPRPRWEEGRVAVAKSGVVFRTRTLTTEPVSRGGGGGGNGKQQLPSPPPPPSPLVVLLLHGFMGTAEDWEGIGEGLLFSASEAESEKRRRGAVVVAADLPLHGRTTAVSDSAAAVPPWPAAVAAVRELCSELSERHAGGRPIAVVGYSLGARLAAAAAAENRGGGASAIARLALVAGGAPQLSLARSASLRASRQAKDDELAGALLQSAAAEGASAFARSWYASSPLLWAPLAASQRRVFSSSSDSSSSLLEAVVASRAEEIEARASDLAAALSGFSPGTTTSGSCSSSGPLSSSTPPTLFVAGGEDPRCASEATAAAAAAAKEGENAAELVILEGVGHAVPSEAPVALAGVLADWLSL